MPIRKDNVLSDGLVTQANFPVSSYGASPNTGTDQTLYIQAALDAANAAGGGRVEINAAGTYIVTGVLTSGGASPTAPHTTLNSALVIYSNTEIRCVPGVEIKLGLVKDDSKCYMIRNANPTATAYNRNITIDGGFWNGGGIIEESTILDGTTIQIPGDYASRLPAGTVFTVSSSAGKVSFTVDVFGSSYADGVTSIKVASSANGAGGLQSSWQTGNIANPAITGRTIGAPGVVVVSGDYTAYAGIGSTCYIYGNAGATANTTTGYTVASAVFATGSTTITMTGALEGTTTVSGNIAFNYDQLWHTDGARFQHVENLQIRNTKSGGWDKYSWWLIDCNRFVFSDNQFNNGSDGFHIGGLCKNGVVRNTSGRCLDNMIPLVNTELWYRPALYATTQGDIKNILIDGFFCDSSIGVCLEPVRLTGKTYVINDITIRGGRGTVGSGYAIRLGDDNAAGYGLLAGALMNRILIDDINMVVPSGYSVVDISGYGVNSVTVRNLNVADASNKGVYVHSATSATTNTNVAQLTIDGLTNSVAATDKLVQIDALVKDFIGCNWNTILGVGGYTLHVNAGSLGTEGQIYHGMLANVVSRSENASGAATHIALTQTTLPTHLGITNASFHHSVDTTAGTFLQVHGIANIGLDNVFFDGNNSPQYIYLNAATARLRLYGSGVKVTRNKHTVASNNASPLNFIYTDITTLLAGSNASSQLNCSNPDIPLDITTSIFNTSVMSPNTAVTGDTFFNTAAVTGSTGSATGSPGAGRMVFVGDNGEAGGSGGATTSGFWEMVTTPKPLTIGSSTYTISAHQSKMAFENTAVATYTLPPAKLGMTFTFINSSATTCTLTPNASDAMQKTTQLYAANGVAVANTGAVTAGSTVTYKCLIANKWSIVANMGLAWV